MDLLARLLILLDFKSFIISDLIKNEEFAEVLILEELGRAMFANCSVFRLRDSPSRGCTLPGLVARGVLRLALNTATSGFASLIGRSARPGLVARGVLRLALRTRIPDRMLDFGPPRRAGATSEGGCLQLIPNDSTPLNACQ
jgi:hypothetical protein